MSRERLLHLYCFVIGGTGLFWLAATPLPSFSLPGLLVFGGLALLVDTLSFRVPPADPYSMVGVVLLTTALIIGPVPAALLAAAEGLLFGLLTPLIYNRPPELYTMLSRPLLRAGTRAAGLLAGNALAHALTSAASPEAITRPEADTLLISSLIICLMLFVQSARVGREYLQGGRSGVLVWWRAAWPLILGVELAPLPLAALWAAIYTTLGPGYFVLASAGLITAALVGRSAVSNLQRQRRSVRELGLLNEVSRAIIRSELDANALCDLIYREASKIVDTSTFHLGLFEGDTYTLQVRMQDRVRLPKQSFHLAHGDGIIGWIRQTGRALLVEDFAREMERLPARPRYQSERPPRSGIYVPLIAGDMVIGSISVQSYQPGAFAANDLRLLSLIADQAAVAITRARAFSQARQRLLQLQAIREVSQRVTAILNLEELLPSVVRLIRERFHYHPVHIFTIDPERGEIVFRASTATPQAQPQLFERFKPGQGLVGTAVAGGTAVMVGDVHNDTRYISDNLETRSELAVPLKVGDQVIGVLDVQSSIPDDFDNDDLFVMQTLADQIAIAIESANSYRAQQEEAWTLNALLQIAENISQASTLDELLTMIVRLPPLLVGCDRCICLLWDRSSGHFRLVAAYGLNRSSRSDLVGSTIDPLDAPLMARMRDEPAPVLLTDAQAQNEQFPQIIIPCNSGALAALPLLARANLLGVLLLDYDQSSQSFNTRQMAIYTSAVGQIASALESALLAGEAAEAAKLEQELRVAREIQTALLPAAVPLVPGWQLAADWRSARLVGGDFYDFWNLERAKDEGWGVGDGEEPSSIPHPPSPVLGFVIADVSDKGVPAAMFMALSRSLVRAAALDGSPPATALERANRWIGRDSESGMFVTLFYGILDPQTGVLRYCCAGHNPPLLYHAASGDFEELATRGIALGVLEEVHLYEAQTVIAPGDSLVCYTDGVTEAINEGEELFGTERLRTVIAEQHNVGAQGLVQAITSAVTHFTSGQPPFDDLTLVVVQRTA